MVKTILKRRKNLLHAQDPVNNSAILPSKPTLGHSYNASNQKLATTRPLKCFLTTCKPYRTKITRLSKLLCSVSQRKQRSGICNHNSQLKYNNHISYYQQSHINFVEDAKFVLFSADIKRIKIEKQQNK